MCQQAAPHDIVPFIQNSVTEELLAAYPDLKAGNFFDETLRRVRESEQKWNKAAEGAIWRAERRKENHYG